MKSYRLITKAVKRQINKMIYKNTTLDIDVEELDKKLVELKSMLGHSTNEEIRSKLFEIINCYNG